MKEIGKEGELPTRWKRIQQEERGIQWVEEIMDDIIQKAGEIVFERYIQRKVVPFAVQQAKRDINIAIHYTFCPSDSTEEDISSDPTWNFDREPSRSEIDSWARGILHKRTKKQLPTEITPKELSLRDYASFSQGPTGLPQTDASITKRSTKHPSSLISSPSSPFRSSSMSLESNLSNGSTARKVHSAASSARTTLKDKNLAEESAKLERLKQEMRGREYTYSSTGEIIVMNKIDPDKMAGSKMSMKLNVKTEEDVTHGRAEAWGRGSRAGNKPQDRNNKSLPALRVRSAGKMSYPSVTCVTYVSAIKLKTTQTGRACFSYSCLCTPVKKRHVFTSSSSRWHYQHQTTGGFRIWDMSSLGYGSYIHLGVIHTTLDQCLVSLCCLCPLKK
ncbi:hypothetical protein PROFUN_09127 [Planoprotostelium fungivorum]|uniref:Uncharacterized protein n=1 Tax=Planoprotostelium fungivorum TaxID=1890364 RepID=A0A2P6NHZ3_9EUKA|nr:hypothetical protein PROFUN_09127 [Planoprotostelium fungivorum]